MAQYIKLNTQDLKPIRTVDERLVSYNIEMTEVTGGTFWKAYTEGQIAGTEAFKVSDVSLNNFTAMADLMQYYPPIDLYNERLRELAKKLGSAWIRVSGPGRQRPTTTLTERREAKRPRAIRVCYQRSNGSVFLISSKRLAANSSFL